MGYACPPAAAVAAAGCATCGRRRYLTLPPRRPDYRRSRPHADFMRPLRALAPGCTAEAFLRRAVAAAGARFELQDAGAAEAMASAVLAPQEFEPRTAWVRVE